MDFNNVEMRCQGPIPEDLIKPISVFAGRDSLNLRSQKSLLGVYEYFNSGNVIYGNNAWQYINHIGDKILSANGIDLDIKFYLLRSSFYNAFATDDGYIFLSTTLLSNSQSEDEIAFILSHELSHVIFQHNTKSYEFIDSTIYQKRNERKNRHSSDKIEVSSFDKLLKKYYAYSREHEFEADSMALILYKKAGYSVSSIKDIIKNLKYDFPLGALDSYEPGMIEPGFDDSIMAALQTKCSKHKNLFSISGITYKESEVNNYKNEDYSTHPDWKLRLSRISKQIIDSEAFQTIQIIPDSLRISFLYESAFYAIKHQQYANSLVYLHEIKKITDSETSANVLTGIALASYYFEYLSNSESISYNEDLFKDPRSGISKAYFHLFSLNKAKLLKLSYWYLNYNKTKNYFIANINTSIVRALKKIPVFNQKSDTLFLKICNSKEMLCRVNAEFNAFLDSFYTANPTRIYFKAEEDETDFESFRDNTMFNINPNNYSKQVRTNNYDTIILLAPMIGQYNIIKKYNFQKISPFTAEDNMAYFRSEMVKYGKYQKIKYQILDYNEKSQLNTETYNNFYTMKELILESFSKPGSNTPKLSSINVDRFRTLGNRVQIIQGITFIKKPKILGRFFVDGFSYLFEVFQFGKEESIYETIQPTNKLYNVIFNLQTMKVEYVGTYTTTLLFNSAFISTMAMRITSHTKQQIR